MLLCSGVEESCCSASMLGDVAELVVLLLRSSGLGEAGREGGGVGVPMPRKSNRRTHVCRLMVTLAALKSASKCTVTYRVNNNK